MSPDAHPAHNHATFDALAGGATLMRASFADHAFERHSHDCYAIGATTRGIQRFRCKGRQYDSRPGDFVLFNPDEDHDGRPGTREGFRYTLWYLPAELLRGRYFARPHVSDPGMGERFEALSASLAGAAFESLRTESLVRAFADTMLGRHGETDSRRAGHPSAAALARARDYLQASYASDITVADLAAASGLSRAHLTRAFGQAFHMPPHTYLNAVRIAQAQKRIRLGLPLASVALACGFADQSHLTRRFKGSVGVTPSAWRRMMVA